MALQLAGKRALVYIWYLLFMRVGGSLCSALPGLVIESRATGVGWRPMKKIIVCALIVTLSQSHRLMAAEIPAALKALHVLNRLGFGPRPGDIDRVNTMGVDHYIHQQ